MLAAKCCTLAVASSPGSDAYLRLSASQQVNGCAVSYSAMPCLHSTCCLDEWMRILELKSVVEWGYPHHHQHWWWRAIVLAIKLTLMADVDAVVVVGVVVVEVVVAKENDWVRADVAVDEDGAVATVVPITFAACNWLECHSLFCVCNCLKKKIYFSFYIIFLCIIYSHNCLHVCVIAFFYCYCFPQCQTISAW